MAVGTEGTEKTPDALWKENGQVLPTGWAEEREMSKEEMASQPGAWVPRTRVEACWRRAALALPACSLSILESLLQAVSWCCVPWFCVCVRVCVMLPLGHCCQGLGTFL